MRKELMAYEKVIQVNKDNPYKESTEIYAF